ncbi:MAG: family 2 glycosyl transferase [Armatimonadetes bacterium CSP1-3]|nr:MAG: family 2 glycosyl transferase [Armatimonadetes bacterium CSP1-3]
MSRPLASVVIPAHNYGRYLAAAVESALGQTYAPLEVIVVDDGSTDDTAEILRGFAGRVRALRLEGRGVAAARNAGLFAAEGEYVLFLDADDLLLPEGVAHLARHLQEHPDADAAYGLWYQCDTRLRRAFIVRSPIRDGPVLPRLFLGNIVATPSAMLLRRQTLIAAGGFDRSLTFTADWEMWLRLARRGCMFGAVPRPVAVYRIHARSMSGDLARAARDVWQVLDRYFSEPTLPRSTAAARPDAYYNMGLYLAKLHLEQGDQDGAVAQLRTALAHRPDRAASLDLYYYLARAIRRRGQLTGTPGVDEVADATLALADRLPAAGLPNSAERPALVYLAAGLMLRHAGKYRAALRCLGAALHLSPRVAAAPRHIPVIVRICVPPRLAAARGVLRHRPRAAFPPLVATALAAEDTRRPAGIPAEAK